MSILQIETRKRNFCKMRINGMLGTINAMLKTNDLTGSEKNELKKILKKLQQIEKNWSKEWKFLKIFKKLI